MCAFFKNCLFKMIAYLRKNRSAGFLLGFMILLVVAAVALSVGLVFLAEVLGDTAYFSLLIGVVLQLVSFLKQNRKTGENPHNSN